MSHAHNAFATVDVSPDQQEFLEDVISGLSQSQKQLSSKYLYDQRGSELFEQICELDEYYPTRTETKILQSNLAEISQTIGPRCLLIEPGSGSGAKTRMLLSALDDIAAFVPVDISGEFLKEAAADIASDFPDLEVLPVVADFTADFVVPTPTTTPKRKVIFFPGSTLGNFDPPHQHELLRQMAKTCGHDGGCLIGVDLQKDIDVLEAAYNDAEGVTAAFNFNLLTRINRELDGNFDLDGFDFRATYNPDAHRIESRLISRKAQVVTIADTQFTFEPAETIWTESSHKFTIEGFAKSAENAGLVLEKSWTDQKNWFAVVMFKTSK